MTSETLQEWVRFLALKAKVTLHTAEVQETYLDLRDQQLLFGAGSGLPCGGITLWQLATELVEIRKVFCAQIDICG